MEIFATFGWSVVRGAGLEPARYFYHEPLKLACLPFHHPRTQKLPRPPLTRRLDLFAATRGGRRHRMSTGGGGTRPVRKRRRPGLPGQRGRDRDVTALENTARC